MRYSEHRRLSNDAYEWLILRVIMRISRIICTAKLQRECLSSQNRVVIASFLILLAGDATHDMC